jgi:hypothetical protein
MGKDFLISEHRIKNDLAMPLRLLTPNLWWKVLVLPNERKLIIKFSINDILFCSLNITFGFFFLCYPEVIGLG